MTYHREMGVTKDMRIAELEAEVAALRVDAERYRWLRDVALDYDADRMTWCVIGSHAEDCVPCHSEELDAAIDEARKA